MYVIRFSAKNFRNIMEEEIFPCEGVNVIYGGNAQGKTNLLEGIWLFTGGHSFRGARDSEMTMLDENGRNTGNAKLEMDFFSEEREQEAALEIDNGKRLCYINGAKKNSGVALIGKVKAVIFSPEHLMLVKEGPSYRRRFLDCALCQVSSTYANLAGTYRHILLQRNALLKEIAKSPNMIETLPPWDARMVDAGAKLVLERKKFSQCLEPYVKDIFGGICQGREEIEMTYVPTFRCTEDLNETKENFFNELKRMINSDLRMGFTGIGPHRDDIDISINGVSAKSFGSQGQQRSIVLAMKLAEAKMLEEFSGETPIVLLDDVLSELDSDRQNYLLNRLKDQQVFITCCDPNAVGKLEAGMRMRVEAGTVFPEELE